MPHEAHDHVVPCCGDACRLVNEAEKEGTIDSAGPSQLTALFGALYTLAKEKINDSANIAMLAIWVDFLMIFTLILMPEYPWEVDSNLWSVPGLHCKVLASHG